MKKLIVVRHGECGHGSRLNDTGRQQMKYVAGQLQPHVTGCRVRMLVSTAPRAVDSADVLARELMISAFEQHEILWSDDSHPQNNEGALDLIQGSFNDVDVLIIVTHFEYARDLPYVFGRDVLGAEIRPYVLIKGGCRIVSCEQKTATVLS